MSCSTQTTDERGNGIPHAKTLGLSESTSAIEELFRSTALELFEGSADGQARAADFFQRNANAIFEVTRSSTFRRLRMINVMAAMVGSFTTGRRTLFRPTSGVFAPAWHIHPTIPHQRSSFLERRGSCIGSRREGREFG